MVSAGIRFGLYSAVDFRLADGRCGDAATSRPALWYFENETIALPLPGRPTAGYTRGLRASDDVRAWSTSAAAAGDLAYPPLVWVTAPLFAEHVLLDQAGAGCSFSDGSTMPMRLTPRIASNRSYFDESSARSFAGRSLRIRGTLDGDTLVARTIWPEDLRLDPMPPLHQGAAIRASSALRALIRSDCDAFEPVLVWQRKGLQQQPFAPDRPVLALVLNGAQGDDDEAHGGHFAVATGRAGSDGAMGDWLVNNYYSLDVVSEKGTLAAPLPLDVYLGDLNSGQNWYRPSYLLVAALSSPRAAVLVQGALNRVYNQFYRHQTVYRHASMNCGGISVDALRALGWNIPARSPEHPFLGALSFPYLLARDRSLTQAKSKCDYLLGDQTRLLPGVTFEEAGVDLIALATGGRVASDDGLLASLLASDIDAIAFVRVPQFPSSRAKGGPPAASLAEYQTRLPRDPTHMQIIPLPARPFPPALRDPDLLGEPWWPSDWVAMGWGVAAVALATILISGFLA